jgi:uncharacterized protein
MTPVLSNAEARRLFLHRHALAEVPKGATTGSSLASLIDSIGFVQVDSINTVERAHHMILWARRQGYRPPALKSLLEQDRALFEHWTHDASILPMSLFPYWKHRFARDTERLHGNWKRWFRDGYEAQFDTILNRIARDGPVSSSDVGEGEARGKGGWWDWHPSKTALEWLWRTGQIAVTRRDGFRKVYDLTENVVPSGIYNTEVGHEALIEWACSSALDRLGFATASEIAKYWYAVDKKTALAWAEGQIATGRLRKVMVTEADGTQSPALTRPETYANLQDVPAPPARVRILSPFDPALRDRDRVERLFGFHYRIEVFVPEKQRQFGYYVFPVLEGSQLIGRLDCKAWRAEGCLRVRGFWPEPGVKMGKARLAGLEADLSRLADFAGCARLEFDTDWLRHSQVP